VHRDYWGRTDTEARRQGKQFSGQPEACFNKHEKTHEQRSLGACFDRCLPEIILGMSPVISDERTAMPGRRDILKKTGKLCGNSTAARKNAERMTIFIHSKIKFFLRKG
jgi:hypothetical protein